MNNILTKLFPILLLCLLSCNKTDKIKITIHVFTQQIGNDGSNSFPDDFKPLFLPFESSACKDTIEFISVNSSEGVFVNRIDAQDQEEIKFDFSTSLGKSVSENTQRMTNIINKYFTSKKIGNAFCKPNGKPDYSKLEIFQDRIVVLSQTIDGDSITINGYKCKVFQNINIMKKFVSDDLCERYHSHKSTTNYAILYNVTTVSKKNTGDSIKQHNDKSKLDSVKKVHEKHQIDSLKNLTKKNKIAIKNNRRKKNQRVITPKERKPEQKVDPHFCINTLPLNIKLLTQNSFSWDYKSCEGPVSITIGKAKNSQIIISKSANKGILEIDTNLIECCNNEYFIKIKRDKKSSVEDCKIFYKDENHLLCSHLRKCNH